MISVAYCTASACSPFVAVICDRTCRALTSSERSLMRRASIQGASSPGRNGRLAMMPPGPRRGPTPRACRRGAMRHQRHRSNLRRARDRSTRRRVAATGSCPIAPRRPVSGAVFFSAERSLLRIAATAVSTSRGGASGQTTEVNSSLVIGRCRSLTRNANARLPWRPGERPLVDERLTVFHRNSPRQIDAQCRQAFANLQAMFRQSSAPILRITERSCHAESHQLLVRVTS